MSDQLFDSTTQSIPQPKNEDIVIWRYMDFSKFVAMLETQSLFFARVSHFDDPFEGSYPASQSPLQRLRGLLPAGAIPDGATISLSRGLEDSWKAMRNWTMVSCWHAVAHESAAMWKLYSPVSAGVTIRSTVGRLRQSIGAPLPPPAGFFGGDRFHIGMVEYIDFQSAHIPTTSFAAQFFRKRRSFEHEQELRALLMQWPVKADRSLDLAQVPNEHGRSISVDLKVLIDEIRVAPQSPQWFFNLVSKVTARYGIEVAPAQSDLDAEPLY